MKEILLTIDDGPSPDTKRLVDFLGARKIPAIMFFIGEKMEQYPDQVDYVIQAGIPIGNHTYTHPAMSKISLRAGIDEIEQTEKVIEAAYQRNAKPREHKLLRFPYLDMGGENQADFMKYLRQHGFKHVDAGFVTYKWYDPLRVEPHIGGTFHCWDWELWINSEKFGIPELLEKLHVTDEKNLGSLFSGKSGEIFVIHDVGWKTPDDERHYEIIVNELEKTKVRYVQPVFAD